MTDSLDELMELKPTHASALLIDPVELAERAGGSARDARRRANLLTGLTAVAAVAVVVALGAMFLRPTQAIPGASPSPEFPYPSSTPMSSYVPMYGGDEAADYSKPRVVYGELTGGDRPDTLCVWGRQGTACVVNYPVTGLTWSQVPWRDTAAGGPSTADAYVWGYFNGTSIRATAVSPLAGTDISVSHPVPSPAAPTTALITCERTLTGSGYSMSEGLASAAGVAAVWMDADFRRLMVAATGDLDAVEVEVRAAWTGPACIGSVPAEGPLADLLAAEKRLREAKVEGVVSVGPALEPGGVLEVTVVANVPGLRERVVAVTGASVSLTIVPLFVTVNSQSATPSGSRT